MGPVVSCICGERIEVEAGQSLDAVECPSCGRTIAGERRPGAVAMSTQALFAEPEEETGPTIVCPNCAGEGKCPVCIGRSDRGFFGWLMDLIDGAFDSVGSIYSSHDSPYGRHSVYYRDRSIEARYIRLKACAGCNGSRRCFKCRGTGSCAGPG